MSESSLLRPNLVLGDADLVRGILSDISGVLRKGRAAFVYIPSLFSVSIYVPTTSVGSIHEKFHSIAILQKIDAVGAVLKTNTVRPASRRQAEDILMPLQEIILRYQATLESAPARKGLVLTSYGAEVAVVKYITPFSAETLTCQFRFEEEEMRPKVVVDEGDIARVRQLLGK